jgi:dephospho-CoA kinase
MIFLTGHHASGKTEAARILAEHFNFLSFEVSHIALVYKQKTRPDLSGRAWEVWIKEMRGPNAINQFILETIIDALHEHIAMQRRFQDIVITGYRQPADIEYLYKSLIANAELLPRTDKLLVYLTAPAPILYCQYLARKRDGDHLAITWEQFVQLLAQEKERGLEVLAQQSVLLENAQEGIAHLEETLRHFVSTAGYSIAFHTRPSMPVVLHELPSVRKNL